MTDDAKFIVASGGEIVDEAREWAKKLNGGNLIKDMSVDEIARVYALLRAGERVMRDWGDQFRDSVYRKRGLKLPTQVSMGQLDA